MEIKKELKFHTFVLLSEKTDIFKPSEFSKYWFDSKQIITANSIKDSSLFSPEFASVVTDNLNLVVTEDQIQIASKNDDFESVIHSTIKPLCENISSSSLNAVGINFNWFIFESSDKYLELTKRFFYNEKDPAASFFNDSSSLYGTYYSKDITKEMRLKLSITPAFLYDAPTSKTLNCVHFAFNFHSDLRGDQRQKQLLDIVNRFHEWGEITSEIMASYQ